MQNCHSGGLCWFTVLLEIHKGVWFHCFPSRIGKWDRRSAGDEERAWKCLVSSWSQIKWVCQGAWFRTFSPFSLGAEMRKKKTTTQKAGARRVWRRSGEWESLGCCQDILTMGPQVEFDGSNTWDMVLQKTLESPLDCKEIQPVYPKGDWSWVFIGRTDAEVETPILWPPHAKSWLIGKDPDAGRDWGLEEKGTTEDEMAGWHHRLDGYEFE